MSARTGWRRPTLPVIPPVRTIGLMSGTSLDGVDGVLVQWAPGGGMRVLADVALPMPDGLRQELLALNTPGHNELHRAALAGNALSRLYAQAVQALLARSALSASAVAAIGAHGQTVRHRPQEFDAQGYTLQLQNPALLAELSGIGVVADLRSRDLAAGGQGAPLVPAFHARYLNPQGQRMALLNLGGIGNLSLLQPGQAPEVRGFDCGPANALLDHWCQRHQGQAFDRDGAWGAGGQIHAALLAHLLQEPFFAAPPPKSTGRDLFNPAWLEQKLADFGSVSAQDVQATLAALSAHAAAQALQTYLPQCERLLVCGGGAYNRHLMALLQDLLPQCQVQTTQTVGLPPLQVEACAFAWLAACWLRRESANLPTVTGARAARILGAFYPA
ncbi:MAG: anhydro-N-acetylmuramic acid kinase [Rhodoferax sp.]